MQLERGICVVALLCVAACHPHQMVATNGASHSVIAQDELDSTHASNVYDAIARLRADFLRDRGSISVIMNQHDRAVVFLNDQEYGILETMRNIPVSRIALVRYFSGPEAVAKFGAQYGGGVVQLISRYE